MLGKVQVKKHERALVFVDGDFKRLLGPGTHRVWELVLRPGRAKLEVHQTLDTLFRHPLLEMLAREPALAEDLLFVDLKDGDRGLVWRDGRLAFALGPGRFALWKRPFELRVETFAVRSLRLAHPEIEAIVAHAQAAPFLEVLRVDPHEETLLFKDGALVDRLTPGRHVLWKGAGRLSTKTLDRREQVIDVAGQEIMTRDKVTLRVNLVAVFQVEDAVKAATVVADHVQALYREAQLALRAAVGARTLDALLEDKEALGSEVRDQLVKRAAEFGLVVRAVGLRDVILPGEMKAILNQVIAAEKEAQANLIRRREETAAARSQANTARLLAENPVLARMKELEALQAVLAGTKATFVLGDGDLAKRIGGLLATGPPDRDER